MHRSVNSYEMTQTVSLYSNSKLDWIAGDWDLQKELQSCQHFLWEPVSLSPKICTKNSFQWNLWWDVKVTKFRFIPRRGNKVIKMKTPPPARFAAAVPELSSWFSPRQPGCSAWIPSAPGKSPPSARTAICTGISAPAAPSGEQLDSPGWAQQHLNCLKL